MMELTKKPNSVPTSKTTTVFSATKSDIKSAVLSQNKSCILCETKPKSICFPITIHKALYTKFASSQNYYYTREINDILLSNRSPKTINYRDIIVYDELAEYLKRFYCQSEFKYKIRILTEYYKFHRDIPRLFMLPIMTTLNRYLDKKRRLDYIKITKIINEENKKEGRQIEMEDFIDSLGDSTSQHPQNSVPVHNIKEENILKDCFDERSKNEDISNFTVQDWKAKLKELTNNSIHIDQSTCSYLDIDAVKNESIGNLSKFLDFMRKNSKDLENKGKFGFLNQNKGVQLKLDDKQRNLTEELKIPNSHSSNKDSKGFLFEKPSNNNIQKLSLTKKLALLNEKAKGNILSLTERSAKKIKFNEMFSKNTEKNQIKRVLTPENQKEIPLAKPKDEMKHQVIKNDDFSKKSKAIPETNKVKIDHHLLNLLLNKVCKKKDENLKLKVSKNPEKPHETVPNSKKANILQIKKDIFHKSPSESPKIKSIDEKKVLQAKKPSHNRIFSNEITKRNSQPNPLYFERSINKTGEGKKLEPSKAKALRSNKASLLRASYNNITGNIDVKCLTERSKEQTPTATIKEKIKQNPINFHKYTKSEPKLIAKGEVTGQNSINSPKKNKPNSKNSSSGQFFTYNNNNVVNIFFNESHKTLPTSSSQLFFDKMKGNLQKVDHSKKNEDLKKLKEKIQLDLHLNLHTG